MSDIPAAAAPAAPEPTAPPAAQPPVVVVEPRMPSGDGLLAGAWDQGPSDDLCGRSLDALLIDGTPVAFLAQPDAAGAAFDLPGAGDAAGRASHGLGHDGLVRPVVVADAALLVEVDPTKPAG